VETRKMRAFYKQGFEHFYKGNRNISLFETLAACESTMTTPMPGAVPEWEVGQLPRTLFCVLPLA